MNPLKNSMQNFNKFKFQLLDKKKKESKNLTNFTRSINLFILKLINLKQLINQQDQAKILKGLKLNL